ncbi:MAG: D-alanyl-D-alanine dipeptidase, D-alanyl-D-alanine dipeptidase [Candidatus Peregrinibacteria bacterium GW2011_GWF2_43_17]|nr:MAG: D-alanyl-D-alanine dipeptidase, D-alanyl-D-alanine dipeptidase [Candidatus Peregrinibacteria bacterium GW2011_GWF2_43_17]HAU39806.1 D-alanyl-D-alanine dipeptidase [Candidatus Peregrinibacteria bacterium]
MIGSRDMSFKLNNEELIDVRKFGFLSDPSYFKAGISDNDVVTAREGVLRRLLDAKKELPQGWNFKIWDGYRTLGTQTVLYLGLYKNIIRKHPLRAPTRVKRATEKFVMRPSFDYKKPSPHNTGAALDLTLVDKGGHELDMGTPFDLFDVSSYTMHFKSAKEGTPGYKWHLNRMIPYSILVDMGFFNFPDEWWHFSYGERLWAKHYGKKALYGSWELTRG